MTVNAAVAAELGFLRSEAEDRMTSACNLWRSNGRMVQDEATGREAPEWTRVATSLPCRVHGSGGARSTRTVNRDGLEFRFPSRVISVPIGTDVRDEDWFEITAGEASGQVFRVLESAIADQQTALRLPVVGDDRPTEWL